ncbi:MAG: hypothetical protein KGY99_06680 [Phycisphaerae bacterium]|nr:hypothetical protein [Phycisphaerae bacterium]
MTVRSVIVGLAAAAFLAAFGYFNDWCLKLPYLASTLVPAAIFGLLVVGLLVVNPLLRWFGQAMRPGEWVVILAFALVGAVVPGPALGWQFGDMLVWPHQHAEQVSWKKHDVLSYIPPRMLADPAGRREAVVDNFITGTGSRPPQLSDVPWGAFSGPLGFYMPLLALGAVATVCTAYVLHGQWAHRERLRYPIAEFTSELVAGAGDSAWPRIYRNRMFWVGFAVSFGVLLINGLHEWFPKFIEIPLRVDLTPAEQKWPALGRVHFSGNFLRPDLFFVAVGFAFFLSSEVSFSVWFSYPVFVVLWLISMEVGVDLHGHFLGGGIWNWQIFGSYVGMTLMLLYVGRRYYGDVLRRVVGLRAHAERVPSSVAWAARVALLCGGAMVVWLVVTVRLHPLLATAFVVLTGMMFIVLTRINAETGLIIIQPRWHVVGVMMGMCGFAALGPNMFIILAVLSTVVAIDPRCCLMPLVSNALRFSETQRVRPRRLTGALVPASLIALAVGIPATLCVQYAFGRTGHFFWGETVGHMPFELLVRELPRYTRPAADWHAFSFAHVEPSAAFCWAAGIGLGGVLLLSFLRLRLPWWPIHPVLLLVLGVDTVTPLCASFFVGWAIRVCVTGFGGDRGYRRAKPLFIGLIAGEFAAGLFWAAGGFIRYAATGLHYDVLRVHPF